MKRMMQARAVVAIVAVAVGLGLLLVPTSASAGVITDIAFETDGPVTVAFGQDWYVRLSVTSTYDEGPTLRLGPTDGTVDVYVSGVGGVFAAALPIQSDGLVYVSQPIDQPLLAAGEYQFSAIYNPAAGGYFDTSQTVTPLSVVVTPLEVLPKVEIINDVAVSERPVITASLTGSYVETTGGTPAGTWRFVVTDAEDQPILESSYPIAEGSTEPLRVEIDSKLEKGASYTVVSSFTPVDELAGGITVGELSDSSFQTPSGTFAEALLQPVPLPIWLAIAIAVIILGLAAAAIALGVKLSSGAKSLAPAVAVLPAQRVPGDPFNVEIVSLNDLGLPDPETIPELLPEGKTQKLPASTTWLLSDVEPATGLPDASEAPTERLDAITAAELPTELLDSAEIDAQAEKPKDS